jgi:hypothetical protein
VSPLIAQIRRWWNRNAPSLPVLLMVGVALSQIGVAWVGGLSPWKGGGFGMFSTVDSPAARFLRIYLVTDDGEIPVLIPDAYQEAARKLCTVANLREAKELLAALAGTNWVGLRLVSAVDYYRYLLQRLVDGDQAANRLRELKQRSNLFAPSIEPNTINFVRALRPDEVLDEQLEQVEVERVRVELWRYRFDQHQLTLDASKLLTIEQAVLAPDAHL